MNLFGQYYVFLGAIPLPVAPEKIEITVPSQNKSVNLVDFSEINVLRPQGLKEIKFDMLVPSYNYPFANYSFGSISTSQIIAHLEQIKQDCKPTYFIVTRCRKGRPAWWTNIKVSLEDFTVTEDANNGTDVMISIYLKEYKEYATKRATVETQDDGTVVAKFNNPRSISSNIAPNAKLWRTVTGNKVVTATLNKGKTLYNTMKTKLGKTDPKVFDALKNANKGLRNVIEEEVEIKLDVF